MLTRRRFLSITAAAAALPLAAPARARTDTVWRGTAMGAVASIRIVHADRAWAEALIVRAVAEIDRLEGVFSLYRGDSAITRLNRDGIVVGPPLELVELLAFSFAVARQSGGAFDPTVQPLFRLYADHFAAPGSDPAGPPPATIGATLERVGYQYVQVDSTAIRFARPGMAVTLNGIAQGYVTDRVADLFRREGLQNVLVDLGEVHALGRRGDDNPWRAAIADPHGGDRVIADLPLSDRGADFAALSTSSGLGSRFDPAGRYHHIFDPHTGQSASHHLSVSVAARHAMVADALSTALSVMRGEDAPALLAHHAPARAYFLSPQGALSTVATACAIACAHP